MNDDEWDAYRRAEKLALPSKHDIVNTQQQHDSAAQKAVYASVESATSAKKQATYAESEAEDTQPSVENQEAASNNAE